MRLAISSAIALFAGACATVAASDETRARLDLSSGRPVIDMVLNDGSSGKFILDTGSQGIVVSGALAARLAVPTVGKARLGSPAGGTPLEVPIVQMGYMRVGSAMVARPEAVVSDALPPSPGGSARPDGVLSPAHFGTPFVEVDVTNASVRFAKTPGRAGQTWSPLDGRGLVKGEMAIGETRLPVHVDTGNPRGMLLPLSVVRQLAPEAALVEVGRLRLVDVDLPRYETTLNLDASVSGHQFRIGKVSVADVPAAMGVVLGMQDLKDYTVAINTQDRTWSMWRSAGGGG
jgi:hypothetical protein